MEADIRYLKKSQGIMIIAILVGIVSLLLSIAKNVVVEYWALRRDNVACVPADVDHAHPLVYRQTTFNPTEEDAHLKSFVEDYVHNIMDENIIDYHAVSNSDRYKDARLSKSKWAAIEMSQLGEKAVNMKRYTMSNETYYTLKQLNAGFVFLIDDILIKGVPQSGSVLAVVRGSFIVVYDKEKVDLPAKLWGYREIYLVLNQGIPTENKEGFANKDGWFVTWSSTQVLSPQQKEKLDKRSKDFYLMDGLK